MADGAVRGSDHQGQPRGEGRPGWTAVLVHRAHGDRRRQRPRRPRLRQGQGGRARGAEGHRRGAQEPVRRAARRLDHRPPRDRRRRRRAACCSSPPHPAPASSPAAPRAPILEMAGIRDIIAKSLGSSNAHQRGARDDRRASRQLRRPDDVAALARQVRPTRSPPAGVLRAYRERRREGDLTPREVR